MHRIDVPSATSEGKFTDGSPTGGVPATIVPADWLNDLQENVVAVVLAAGITLTKGRANDLLDAISVIAGGNPTSGATVNDYMDIPVTIRGTGAKKNIRIQWGVSTLPAISADAIVPLPISFTESFLALVAFCDYAPGSGTTGYVSAKPLNLSSFTARSNQNLSNRYIAIGI